MAKNYTKILSEFLVDLSYDEIPAEAIEQAKKLTLHTLGAAFSCQSTEQADKAKRIAESWSGKEEATVWGSKGEKLSVESVAFANGTMADILDWEDCAWTGHPSAGAIPVAFAMAEKEKKTGKDYLTAVITAYEGYHRIAMSEQPSTDAIRNKRRMWGLTSWQIYSASIAAAKILGFDLTQMIQTLGASYYQTFAPATKHAFGLATSDIYHFAHGYCARNGVNAAQIAQMGFENCMDALDGVNGAWNQVSDQVDWDWLEKDLGTKFYITETLMKHWPANMWNQGPVEAAMRMKEKHQFEADDITEIRLSPNIGTKTQGYYLSTRSILDAQFSIPYCVSVYFMDPEAVGVSWFTKERRNDPKLIALTEKFKAMGEEVSTYEMFNIFKEGSFPEVILEVDLKDGRSLQEKLRYPKGHPRNNFTMEEELEHFRLTCRDFVPAEQVEAIIEKVLHLEELEDFSELAKLTVLK